jgi:membrane fusion protein (multidrug efflux system)
MNARRYLSVFIVLSLSLLYAGCKNGQAGMGKGGFSMPPMPVETTIAAKRSIADRFETVGTIEASEAVTIVSEISGIVVSIPFDEGGSVHRGDVIALLDDGEFKADLDRVTALRDQSQLNYNRVKAIVDQGAGAQQDLDDAAAALKVAQANADFARARYNKTHITAPFDGIIGARRISPGSYLRAGDAIADLAQLRELRVNFSMPERYLSDIEHGSEVAVSVTAYPGTELKGKIDVIEPQLDAGTRSARIVARVSNPESKFRPGMSANVAAVLSERAAALTISSEAIFLDQNQSFVYLVKADSSVARAAIQLGTRTRDVVEVTSGLHEGDRVVRAGHQKIYDGAKVIPVMSQDSAAVAKAGAHS